MDELPGGLAKLGEKSCIIYTGSNPVREMHMDLLPGGCRLCHSALGIYALGSRYAQRLHRRHDALG
jgi:hypothetical protein